MSDEKQTGRRKLEIEVEEADRLPGGLPSDEEVDTLVAEAEELPESGLEADELEELRRQYEEEHDRHLRAVAELHNYRRRITQERAQQLQFANDQLLTALLPVIDHFEMAVQHAETDPEAFRQGVVMILQQMRDVTASFGLEPIPTVGEYFDPDRHEAVMGVPTSEICEGMVVEEVRRGYALSGRVLRAAQVKVAVPPAPT